MRFYRVDRFLRFEKGVFTPRIEIRGKRDMVIEIYEGEPWAKKEDAIAWMFDRIREFVRRKRAEKDSTRTYISYDLYNVIGMPTKH